MRHLLVLLAAVSLLTTLAGCGSCVHGKCDCTDDHGHAVVQPVAGPGGGVPEYVR